MVRLFLIFSVMPVVPIVAVATVATVISPIVSSAAPAVVVVVMAAARMLFSHIFLDTAPCDLLVTFRIFQFKIDVTQGFFNIVGIAAWG